MRTWIGGLVFILTSPSLATEAVLTDGDSLRLYGTSFRLDGIDAPEIDQVCLDEKGGAWRCGIEARDQLTAFIRKRPVHCQDMGPHPVNGRTRIGICSVEGETTTLN
jgi:endonuclease YncB( thermonuclease family)